MRERNLRLYECNRGIEIFCQNDSGWDRYKETGVHLLNEDEAYALVDELMSCIKSNNMTLHEIVVGPIYDTLMIIASSDDIKIEQHWCNMKTPDFGFEKIRDYILETLKLETI